MRHLYEDPDTGELFDVVEDDDDIDYRNARRKVRLGDRGGFGRSKRSLQRHGGHRLDRSPGGLMGGHRPGSYRDRPGFFPHGPGMPMGPIVPPEGQYLSIKKSSVAELLPGVGKVLASFLGRPQPPQAVGDDKVDRDNATLHRDALAKHEQNQARILALTDLAARAVKLFAN